MLLLAACFERFSYVLMHVGANLVLKQSAFGTGFRLMVKVLIWGLVPFECGKGLTP